MPETEKDVASLKKAIQEQVAKNMDELGNKINELLNQYDAMLVAKAVINDNGTIGAVVSLSPKQ